jgi:Ankyrin repeats (3 copies)
MKTFRAIAIRISVFLVTLIFGLAVALGCHIYRNRQAVFTEGAFRGYFVRMKVLYHLGVDVNAAGCPHRNCFTPLWGAAYAGRDDEIGFLLDRGADVNSKTNFGGTALMVAAYKGHESTAHLLLSRGADVNANNDGDTALTFAKNKGRSEIAALLRQAGALDTP